MLINKYHFGENVAVIASSFILPKGTPLLVIFQSLNQRWVKIMIFDLKDPRQLN